MIDLYISHSTIVPAQTYPQLFHHDCQPTSTIVNMAIAFVSFELRLDKPVVPMIPEGYVMNICQAALAMDKEGDKGYLQIFIKTQSMVSGDDLNALIGTLRAGQTEQFATNLVFGDDFEITFSVKGTAKGSVHLSGYYQPGLQDEEEDDDEEQTSMRNKRGYAYDDDDDDEMDDVLLR